MHICKVASYTNQHWLCSLLGAEMTLACTVMCYVLIGTIEFIFIADICTNWLRLYTTLSLEVKNLSYCTISYMEMILPHIGHRSEAGCELLLHKLNGSYCAAYWRYLNDITQAPCSKCFEYFILSLLWVRLETMSSHVTPSGLQPRQTV